MPTVLRIDGLRYVIYPNDRRPAHVHVISSDFEAVFFLNAPAGPPELRENYGFSLKSLQKIERRLAENLLSLIAEWRKIHGEP